MRRHSGRQLGETVITAVPAIGAALLLLLLASALILSCSPRPADELPSEPSATPPRDSPTVPPTLTPSPSPTDRPSSEPSATASPSPRAQGAPSTPRVGLRDRPGDYFEQLILRNYPRWFKVHVPPSYTPDVPMPLVFNLHGLGSNLEEQEKLTAMTAKADEAGFIVVYPQAGASVWNIQAGEIGAIDVDFFRHMIDLLLVELNVDPTRIYATGFSNGGGMVHRLACDLSDRIAAIGSVAGAYMQDQICVPRRPVPVLAIHGLADRFAPFLDQSVGQDVPRWAQVWAARNGCDREPQAQVDGPVTVETWQNCRDNASVILYRVEEMGHTWPGSPFGDRYGPGTRALVANDLIWDFFQAHSLSGGSQLAPAAKGSP